MAHIALAAAVFPTLLACVAIMISRDLLALRELATGGYSAAAAFALIVLFNAIMFTLLEVPLVGYALRPEPTAKLVARLAVWLNANGLRVMGWLIGAIGIGLVVEGAVATV